MKKGTQGSKTNSSIVALSVILAVVVIFLGYNLLTVFQQASQDQGNLQLASEMRAQSYRLVGLSREATAGEETAFAELQAVANQMEKSWTTLNANLSEEVSSEQLGSLEKTWQKARQNAQTIIDNKATVIFLNKIAATLNQTLPELQQEHTNVVEILLASRAPAEQVAVAQAQSWRAERIGRNVDKMLEGGEGAEEAASQFNRDASLFGQVLEGMKSGNSQLGISRVTGKKAGESLESITERFAFVSSSVQEIFEATPALFRASRANHSILDESPLLQEQISQLSDAVTALPENRDLTYQTALYAGVLAVILLAVMGLLITAETRRRLRETATANEHNQRAILRLLDEIEGLGEGDLTRYATVTEDFTGNIADAINSTIDQLRILVAQIQDTSENVSAAANETRATALQLAEASEHQAHEISGASDAISDMVIVIDQVSANSSESAMVAEKSVSIAKKGAEVVQSTIGGMDTTRKQIQDTSKRIKRLGESSQEIGDIVSVINDIADQTNILALNAAIQASMAGDAGRGFAVVADEVQRLAERSAVATKQIASLVKTIQTDTNEAVNSMEQTTAEVVKGAERAHAAGGALEEIETVSADLAKLIRDISTAASHQSTTAGQVSRTMNVIQDISAQTLSGTNNTAQSIGELADLAVELRGSVSGFKLPSSMERKGVSINAPAHNFASEKQGFDFSGISSAANRFAEPVIPTSAPEEDFDLSDEDIAKASSSLLSRNSQNKSTSIEEDLGLTEEEFIAEDAAMEQLLKGDDGDWDFDADKDEKTDDLSLESIDLDLDEDQSGRRITDDRV
ncbi:MAG: methyl-accepting chemotaxis protein [Porticoccus sp.]|nr:methyl-accepting chemotaxis protein [Porticoccus sp.]